jgi:hypothetical protein
MGLWATITGAGKVSEVVDTGLDLVKKGASGIDMTFYTDEEKAIAGAQNIVANMGHALEFARLAQNESGASAVTRRIFGLIVLGNFTVFSMVGLIALWLDRPGLVENIVKFANAMSIGEITAAVIICMFGYYGITGVTKNKK